MTVLPISTLKENMQIGQTSSITASDIHDVVDTFEARTTQSLLRKTDSYTAAAADNRTIIVFTAAAAVTLTLPNTLPEGWECGLLQMGAGPVTVSVAGTPPVSRNDHTRTAGQYAMANLLVESNASGNAAVVILGGDTA